MPRRDSCPFRHPARSERPRTRDHPPTRAANRGPQMQPRSNVQEGQRAEDACDPATVAHRCLHRSDARIGWPELLLLTRVFDPCRCVAGLSSWASEPGRRELRGCSLRSRLAPWANIGHRQATSFVHFRMVDDSEALNAYSRAVVRVAESVLPSVASLRVKTRRGEGAGSASVLTSDGFLLTSAHVVQSSDAAEAAFTDGTVTGVDVIGRDPLSDLAVLRARVRFLRRCHSATRPSCGSASLSLPWATRWG